MFPLLVYSIAFMCVSISIIVWLNKKLILINKVITQPSTDLYCEIKYLYLYLPLDFSSLVFSYH